MGPTTNILRIIEQPPPLPKISGFEKYRHPPNLIICETIVKAAKNLRKAFPLS